MLNRVFVFLLFLSISSGVFAQDWSCETDPMCEETVTTGTRPPPMGGFFWAMIFDAFFSQGGSYYTPPAIEPDEPGEPEPEVECMTQDDYESALLGCLSASITSAALAVGFVQAGACAGLLYPPIYAVPPVLAGDAVACGLATGLTGIVVAYAVDQCGIEVLPICS